MDAFLYSRYRAQGGDQPPLQWQFGGPSRWDEVSAPAEVGRRLYEGCRQRPLDERWARLISNIVHWGYGMGWGGAFGLVAGSRLPTRIVYGPAFGGAVWVSSYVTLPIAGLYKLIWEYSLAELGPDLLAHLTYGMTAERVFRSLS